MIPTPRFGKDAARRFGHTRNQGRRLGITIVSWEFAHKCDRLSLGPVALASTAADRWAPLHFRFKYYIRGFKIPCWRNRPLRHARRTRCYSLVSSWRCRQVAVGFDAQPILSLIVSGLVYLIVLLVLKPLSADELQRLRPLLPSRLRRAFA